MRFPLTARAAQSTEPSSANSTTDMAAESKKQHHRKRSQSTASVAAEVELPKTIQLNCLIKFNPGLRGKTTAYRDLAIKQKKQNLEIKPIRSDQFFAQSEQRLYDSLQFKVSLLAKIENLLLKLDTFYQDFCNKKNLTDAQKIQMVHFFENAILRTMDNQAAITTALSLPMGKEELKSFFDSLLIGHWLSLISEGQSVELPGVLAEFKHYLAETTGAKEAISPFICDLKPDLAGLVDLVKKEIIRKKAFEEACNSGKEFEGYYSLRVLLKAKLAEMIALDLFKDSVIDEISKKALRIILDAQENTTEFSFGTGVYIIKDLLGGIKETLSNIFNESKIKTECDDFGTHKIDNIGSYIDKIAALVGGKLMNYIQQHAPSGDAGHASPSFSR